MEASFFFFIYLNLIIIRVSGKQCLNLSEKSRGRISCAEDWINGSMCCRLSPTVENGVWFNQLLSTCSIYWFFYLLLSCSQSSTPVALRCFLKDNNNKIPKQINKKRIGKKSKKWSMGQFRNRKETEQPCNYIIISKLGNNLLKI